MLIVLGVFVVIGAFLPEEEGAGAKTTTVVGAETTTVETETTTTTLPPVLAEGGHSGDDVVEIASPETVAIVTWTHDGSGNFSIWSLDSTFETIDLLVNTIGNYEGTRPIQFEAGTAVSGFEVTAEGNWPYVAEPVTGAEAVACPASGRGDDVVIVEAFVESGGPADLAYSGSDNFAIWTYGNGVDLIVNEIGPYEGTGRVESGLFLWDITGSEGEWTIEC